MCSKDTPRTWQTLPTRAIQDHFPSNSMTCRYIWPIPYLKYNLPNNTPLTNPPSTQTNRIRSQLHSPYKALLRYNRPLTNFELGFNHHSTCNILTQSYYLEIITSLRAITQLIFFTMGPALIPHLRISSNFQIYFLDKHIFKHTPLRQPKLAGKPPSPFGSSLKPSTWYFQPGLGTKSPGIFFG